MKSKTKDINVEIHPVMLDQIYFPMCIYITMWATKKEYAWMVKTKFDGFCRLD
jgi:hypothetical protein